MSGIMARLRETTAQAHADLERQVDIPAACRDAGRYRSILAGFLGFYEPVEQRLARHQAGGLALGLDLVERQKRDWLFADLAALELSRPTIENLPRAGDLPQLETFGQALGMAYVLEGATLGGRQICRLLEGSAIPEGARRFFSGYGAETGEKWRQFCQACEISDASPDEIIGGAHETFASLGRWLVATKDKP